jgi:hypothetical protein
MQSTLKENGTRMVVATVVGILTGAVVIAIERAVEDLLHEVQKGSPWVIALVLIAGAVTAALLAQTLGGRSSSTTETYVEKFHDPEPPLEPRYAPGRLGASVVPHRPLVVVADVVPADVVAPQNQDIRLVRHDPSPLRWPLTLPNGIGRH